MEGPVVACCTISESGDGCKLLEFLGFLGEDWTILYPDIRLLFSLNYFSQRSQTNAIIDWAEKYVNV